MSTHEISLALSGVSVTYAEKPVIKDINLELYSGEIFGLMGLNGAGKTTMIKSILGLRDQDEGEILIYGKDKSDPQSKSRLSFLPEKFEPPWFLTGMEFMQFCFDLYKQPFNKEDIITAAESLALDTAALKRRMHTYSKGMRQKLGLMGTLLMDCSLFILDEPMSGLDPRARALVKKMINDVKDKDRTVFLSSHILADMDEICDRVAVLHNNHIMFIGKPAELKSMTGADNLEQAYLEYIEQKDVV